MHLPFAEANGKACGECAAFARDECTSYCKKSKPTNVKISIILVTGGGLKTDTGVSAPVLPLPFFSTRQVFILTTLNKLLFMVKTLSWNQTMANIFRKSFAILLYLIRQKTVGFYWNPPTYFIEFVISLQRLNLPSLAFANHSPIRFSKQNAFAISLQRGTAFAHHSPQARPCHSLKRNGE